MGCGHSPKPHPGSHPARRLVPAPRPASTRDRASSSSASPVCRRGSSGALVPRSTAAPRRPLPRGRPACSPRPAFNGLLRAKAADAAASAGFCVVPGICSRHHCDGRGAATGRTSGQHGHRWAPSSRGQHSVLPGKGPSSQEAGPSSRCHWSRLPWRAEPQSALPSCEVSVPTRVGGTWVPVCPLPSAWARAHLTCVRLSLEDRFLREVPGVSKA